MFYYTYVLKSQLDKEIYIGWTDNLKHRVTQHNRGLVEATKGRRPLDLVYYEACLTRERAIMREKQLKSGYGRAYLRRRL